MLNLAEDPSSAAEDWGILKDFLGFRLPHERETDHGEVDLRLTRTICSPCPNPEPYLRQPEPHLISHPMHSMPNHQKAQHSHMVVTAPHSLPSTISTVEILHAAPLSIPSSSVPLPSITTLVRHSPPNDLQATHEQLTLTPAPVDLSSIKTEYAGRNAHSVSHPSAFRAVASPTSSVSPVSNCSVITPGTTIMTPSASQPTTPVPQGPAPGPQVSPPEVLPPTCEYDRPPPSQKASASLLRDLLVLGKPPQRPQGVPPDQSRLGGLVRSGSMEQRWQDLASLLSLPSPDAAHHAHAQSPPTPTMASHATSPVHAHPAHAPPPPPIHHPHALYPTHEGVGVATTTAVQRGVLIHNATLPPPMPDAHNMTYTNSMGASSHLVASSMNLTNNSDIHGSDQQPYKMENSSALAPDMMYYQNSGAEMNQTTDGFLSSILNDEDLQLMDIPMTDYNGRGGGGGDYVANSYRYGPPEDPHRLPPVAQKKHQMFGKRFFHENPHAGAPSNNIGANGNNVGPGVPLVGSYPPHYVTPAQGNPAMEGATAMDPSEMKYSCTMDFRPEVSGSAVDHVQHNHTYQLSPEGPSGINRPHARDKKGRKSDMEKSLSRDEKRARAMNLPITCDDIINLPMDEFNERISKYDLTEPQLSLIRDIRRRGKNKVAAQNCRKRKLDQIVHLAEEVKVIQYRKNELNSQLDHLGSEMARLKQKFLLLYQHIFRSLRDPDGNPYSEHEYSLQQSADGSVLLVPRSSPPHSMDQGGHSSKGRHHKEHSGH